MPQNDPYAKFVRGLESPAVEHFTITPADDIDLPTRPRALRVLTSGNLRLRDGSGTKITYGVSVGEVIPFSARGVEATGTTATVAGWL